MIKTHKLYFCIFLNILTGAITQTAEALTIPNIPAIPSAEAISDSAANPYGQVPAAIPQIPKMPNAVGSDTAENPFGQTTTFNNPAPQNPMQPTKTIKKKKKMNKKAKRKKGCGCKSYIPVGKRKKPYYCGY